MCKPHRCPHIAMTGNICVYAHSFSSGNSKLIHRPSYCPGGPDSDFDYSTQSYTGYEPTSMRAIRARYDPYEQTRGRVEQLKSLGHSVDKVGFVICSWNGIIDFLIGGVHRDGWYFHEHAGRLPKQVYCATSQRTLWLHGHRCCMDHSLLSQS